MLTMLRAEHLKTKHTLRRHISVLFPVLTGALAFVITCGMQNSFAESVWNWWYVLLLPGMLSILCQLSIAQEKKQGFYHMITLPIKKRLSMLGKIAYLGGILFTANAILGAIAIVGGGLLTTEVPISGAILAVGLLAITQLWEIPVLLFFSERFGMVVELLVCLFFAGAGTIVSQTKWWYLLVSAIPMRIACPLLHVLPNGLHANSCDPLLDAGVIIPGVVLSLVWFVVITVIFLHWFEKREERSC